MMQLNYKDVKSDRQWRATIGLPEEKFHLLVALFKASYESTQGVSLPQGAANLGKTLLLCTYEDSVFYVLFQLKSGLTYDVLGFLIGTDGTHARRLFDQHKKTLEITLFQSGDLPRRNFDSLTDFQALLKAQTEVILDVTEVGVNRAGDYQAQKQDYSGKKDIPRRVWS